MPESTLDYLRRNLRKAGAARWGAIAESANKSLPPNRRMTAISLRKLAYGDKDNPGLQQAEALVTFFRDVEAGKRKLPKAD
jgi:hypothetical protein